MKHNIFVFMSVVMLTIITSSFAQPNTNAVSASWKFSCKGLTEDRSEFLHLMIYKDGKAQVALYKDQEEFLKQRTPLYIEKDFNTKISQNTLLTSVWGDLPKESGKNDYFGINISTQRIDDIYIASLFLVKDSRTQYASLLCETP